MALTPPRVQKFHCMLGMRCGARYRYDWHLRVTISLRCVIDTATRSLTACYGSREASACLLTLLPVFAMVASGPEIH